MTHGHTQLGDRRVPPRCCDGGHRSKNHNPESWYPRYLRYDSLGGDVLRSHLILYREYDDIPVIHIPVSRRGVVP